MAGTQLFCSKHVMFYFLIMCKLLVSIFGNTSFSLTARKLCTPNKSLYCLPHLSASWNSCLTWFLDVGGVAFCNINTGITQLSAWRKATVAPPTQFSLSPALFLGLLALFISKGTFHRGLTENRLFTASPGAFLRSRGNHTLPVFLCLACTCTTCTATQTLMKRYMYTFQSSEVTPLNSSWPQFE